MVGSGPFKVVEYEPNAFVRLEITGSHPLYSPKIGGVTFQTFENQDALVQALKTGQVDMITEMPNTAVATLQDEASPAPAPAAPGCFGG
jgi:peptide/nickel transport system substrate-binding protein